MTKKLRNPNGNKKNKAEGADPLLTLKIYIYLKGKLNYEKSIIHFSRSADALQHRHARIHIVGCFCRCIRHIE